MGQKGREISKVDKKWVLNELRKAYAFEWVVHYYAALAPQIISGLRTPVYAEIFEEAAKKVKPAKRLSKAEYKASPLKGKHIPQRIKQAGKFYK